MQTAASATFEFFLENTKTKRDAKNPQNGRKSAQKAANGRKLKKRHLLVFLSIWNCNLLLLGPCLFAKISDQSMSAERLSSCNTLAEGVSRVIEMEGKNPKSTKEARDTIAARIQAIPCTHCTNIAMFKVCSLLIVHLRAGI